MKKLKGEITLLIHLTTQKDHRKRVLGKELAAYSDYFRKSKKTLQQVLTLRKTQSSKVLREISRSTKTCKLKSLVMTSVKLRQ